jgi:radical SAM superfamily enzyme YgiQ (UPF0313 family)
MFKNLFNKYIENPEDYSFEIGPVGAIGEQGSLFVRINRYCPWNKCLFCPAYKNEKFEYRSKEEIKKDIDRIKLLVDEIRIASLKLGYKGEVNSEVIRVIILGNQEIYGNHIDPKTLNSRLSSLYHVANWLSYGQKTSFLQDANALIMRTAELIEVIRYLKESFPSIERITSYARSKTCAKKSIEELKELHDAGLSRLLVGLESGCDEVLDYMQKGVTAEGHIKGGRNVVESGIYLAEFIMPGLGGKKWSRQHVLGTADVLNKINPDLIKIRSLAILEDSPLFEKYKAGEFEWLTDDEMVDEIDRLIHNLNCNSYLISDQLTNILFEIEGQLPQDKEKMFRIIEAYKAKSEVERAEFRFRRYERYYLPYVERQGKLAPQLEQLIEEAWESIEKESPDIEEKVDRAIVTMKGKTVP